MCETKKFSIIGWIVTVFLHLVAICFNYCLAKKKLNQIREQIKKQQEGFWKGFNKIFSEIKEKNDLKVHLETTTSNFGVVNKVIIEKVAKEKETKLENLEKRLEELKEMFKKFIKRKIK